MRGRKLGLGLAASLGLLAACQTVPTPAGGSGGGLAPAAGGYIGGTFTILENYPATPSPLAATTVTGQAGPVSTLHGVQGNRTVDLAISDNKPLAIGTSYTVVDPSQLDPTGASPGAALTYSAADGTWVSVEGTVAIDLVSGPQMGCYFKGVVMSPHPGASGGFNLDGEAQAILASPH